jgi:hypothetical protein
VGCSTEAAATRTLAEACCEPLYSFTRLACKSRSSFWLSLRPSLYREGLIREARDVWGSLSSGCGVRSGSGSLKNSQLYNIYYKKSSDSDRSGHITAKEFGQFMKRGVPAAVKTGRGAILEKKRLLAVRNRVALEQEKVERWEIELRATARKVKAHEAEKALLQAELQKLTGKASSASLLASLEQSHQRQTLLTRS